MIIICKTNSGMCNRLIPFITSLRISKILKAEYYLHWNDDCRDIDYPYRGEKTRYTDMFENIENIKYINDQELSKLIKRKRVKKINIYQNIDCNIDKLKQFDIIFFDSLCHPIYLKEDNINFKNWSDLDWIKSDYGISLHEYFAMLRPSKDINEKIDYLKNKFTKDIIGIHLRHWPAGWLKQNKHLIENSLEKVINFIETKLKENPDIKFFISTTDHAKINILVDKFKNNILYYEDRFGDCEDDKYYIEDQTKSTCNRYKNMNGVVDLFLLSKCSELVIDTSSSFSIAALLMNKDIKINLLNHKNY